MDELPFSFDEIIEQLQSENYPKGFTVREMSEITGHSMCWCRKKIRLMIDSGVVEFSGRRPTEAIDGQMRQTPVYRIIEDGNKG